MSEVPPLVLGTAGHIDHGKTALVRALTGRETDRLAEEKARGISIELGFAPLDLPGGRRVGLVDVPGHERFVRHMVAGTTGVDGYLLCVAADDGVMPQTREHLDVLTLLGIERGVVAITRSDLTDPSPAAAEVAALVGPGVEIVPVCAPRGDGIPELLEAIERLVAGLEPRPRGGRPRLYVDRTFSLPGAGTVVTGTLWGGAIARGDHVVVQPAGATARVRGVHVHDQSVERAEGGRVALALAGVARDVTRTGVVRGAGGRRLDADQPPRGEPALAGRRGGEPDVGPEGAGLPRDGRGVADDHAARRRGAGARRRGIRRATPGAPGDRRARRPDGAAIIGAEDGRRRDGHRHRPAAAPLRAAIRPRG